MIRGNMPQRVRTLPYGKAVELIGASLDRGEDAASACKGLMELANRRWSDMVGDYRDDITATVVRLPFLPPPAAAAASAVAAVAKSARGEGYPSIAPGVPVADGVPVHSETPGREVFASETPRDPREEIQEDPLAPDSSVGGGAYDAGGGGDAASLPSSEDQNAAAGDASAGDWDDGAVSAQRSSRLGTCVEDDDEAVSMGAEGAVNDARGLLGRKGQDRCRSDDTAKEPASAVVAPAIARAGLGDEDERKKSSRLPVVVHETLVDGASPAGSLEGIGGNAGREAKGRDVRSEAKGGEIANAATGKGLESGLGGGLKDDASPDGREDDDASYKMTRASRHTDAMEDLRDEKAMAARNANGTSGGGAVDTLCGVDSESHEDGGEDNDDWDLNYGARELREPSREMREASREFLVPSPRVDPLETLVKVGQTQVGWCDLQGNEK